MINKDIFIHCSTKLTAERIAECAKKNGENPFGYVIDYIKDVFGTPKTEGWDTAVAVCKFFNFNV